MARESAPLEIIKALVGDMPEAGDFPEGKSRSGYKKKGRHHGGPRRKKGGGRGKRKHVAGAETVRKLSRLGAPASVRSKLRADL